MDEACFVDEDMEPDPRLNQITNSIIGAAIEVHRTLGPGHLESAYEEAMDYEMTLRGIRFQRQVHVPLMYKGREVGKACLDFVVEESIVLELKSVEQLAPVHSAQVISYLSITRLPLALIINFNVPALRHGIKRIAGRPQVR